MLIERVTYKVEVIRKYWENSDANLGKQRGLST